MSDRTPGLRTVKATNRKAIKAMNRPVTGPDGRVYDSAPLSGSRDPFFDPCPDWCEDRKTGHRMQDCDENRWHTGEAIDVPVRSILGAYEGRTTFHSSRQCIGFLRVCRSRDVLHRDTRVWVGEGESSTGWYLRREEAAALGELLSRLAVE